MKEAQTTESPTCLWSPDEEFAWVTGCGNIFYLTCDTPQDNKMQFCCYCGKPLEGAKTL